MPDLSEPEQTLTYLAGQALGGLISSGQLKDCTDANGAVSVESDHVRNVAKAAWGMAEAMMQASPISRQD
jgi:hypothetical protein